MYFAFISISTAQHSLAVSHPCHFIAMISSCSPGTCCINHANDAHSLASPSSLLAPQGPHAWFLLPSDFSGVFLSLSSSGVVLWAWISHRQEGDKVCLFWSKLAQVKSNARTALGHQVLYIITQSFLLYFLHIASPFCLFYYKFPAHSCDRKFIFSLEIPNRLF